MATPTLTAITPSKKARDLDAGDVVIWEGEYVEVEDVTSTLPSGLRVRFMDRIHPPTATVIATPYEKVEPDFRFELAPHHELKCWPFYFEQMIAKNKFFDIRRDDRGFREGHTITQREWNPAHEKYTGREVDVWIRLIMPAVEDDETVDIRDPRGGIAAGHVLMGLKVLRTRGPGLSE